jgi:hypothetical protein
VKALEDLRDNWRRVRDAEPGSRFDEYYRYRRKRRDRGWPASRIITVAGGTVLLLGGLAIGWVPGPGGFISIFGAALLATEWHPLARLLDRVEVLARDLWRRTRAWWNGSSAPARAAGLLAVAGLAGVMLYLALSIVR